MERIGCDAAVAARMQVTGSAVRGDLDIGDATERVRDGGDVFAHHTGIEDQDVVAGEFGRVFGDIVRY